MVTKDDPMRDLTAYQVHVSLDGSSWELIASAQHHPTPHERDVHIRRSLVSASYLWPYYLIILSRGLAGLSVASASLLSCVVSLKAAARWNDAPVQLLGLSIRDFLSVFSVIKKGFN